MSKIKKTFQEWCVENNRKDLLDRWDYDLNIKLPSEIGSKDNNKYWFKCPVGRHDSELHNIQYFASGRSKTLYCKKCRSFAQHYIDKYGIESLDLIWSEVNEKSPWDYAYNSNKKVVFNCKKNNSHKYKQSIINCMNDCSCPFCLNRTGQSLADRYPDSILYWSDKNNDSPYEHTICDRDQRWWKCPFGKHEDFQRSIIYSRKADFVCPYCKRESKRPKNFKDITGQVFGELIVLEIDVDRTKAQKSGTMYWRCQCSCGKVKSILGSHLRNGSIVSCGDRSIHYLGEDNPNWNNGSSNISQFLRRGKKYRQWRKIIYNKDSYVCQCCGTFGRTVHAHHIYSFSSYEDLRYDVDNGICLCENCHAIHFKNSFHNIYGTHNNTPQQLEEYINNKRKQLGINIPFNIDDYKKRINIITPELAITLHEKKEVV